MLLNLDAGLAEKRASRVSIGHYVNQEFLSLSEVAGKLRLYGIKNETNGACWKNGSYFNGIFC